MPTETPEAMRVRWPPSRRDSGWPSALAWRSQAAISSAAFAMLCPRTARNAGNTCRGCSTSSASSRGARNPVITCHAVSVVSAL